LVVGDELYIVSDEGLASCLDMRKGEPHWQERLPGAYSASPLVADGRIYFLNEEGQGTVLKAGTKFEIVARNPMKERALASYAASAGSLYLRTESAVYRIGTK
jgi:outer membrane protein assembly factor BamB